MSISSILLALLLVKGVRVGIKPPCQATPGHGSGIHEPSIPSSLSILAASLPRQDRFDTIDKIDTVDVRISEKFVGPPVLH